MRDGTNLYADVYIPATGGKIADGKFPTILVRTSYNKEAAERNLDPYLFVERGYAVVLQDVQGEIQVGGRLLSWHIRDG